MNVNIDNLESYAQAIPSMGGTKLGPDLRELIKHLPDNTAIIEVGSWLGAGTAQLAMGVIESGKKLDIHCYDWWQATQNETKKLENRGRQDLGIEPGMDTLPIVKKLLAPFKAVEIVYHKGNISEATWFPQNPISLYIDDAAKKPAMFKHMLRTFGPAWIPGETVLVLMDYWYFKKKPLRLDFRFQKFWIEKHSAHFEYMTKTLEGGSASIIKYTNKFRFSNL